MRKRLKQITRKGKRISIAPLVAVVMLVLLLSSSLMISSCSKSGVIILEKDEVVRELDGNNYIVPKVLYTRITTRINEYKFLLGEERVTFDTGLLKEYDSENWIVSKGAYKNLLDSLNQYRTRLSLRELKRKDRKG